MRQKIVDKDSKKKKKNLTNIKEESEEAGDNRDDAGIRDNDNGTNQANGHPGQRSRGGSFDDEFDFDANVKRVSFQPTRNDIIRSLTNKEGQINLHKQVFSEVDELDLETEEWVERARWIKFQQDAEDFADRWGKPHVSSLTFQAVSELKKNLAHGTVILEMDEETLPDIMTKIADTLIDEHQIDDSIRGLFLFYSQLRHRYMRPNSSINKIRRKNNPQSSSAMSPDGSKRTSVVSSRFGGRLSVVSKKRRESEISKRKDSEAERKLSDRKFSERSMSVHSGNAGLSPEARARAQERWLLVRNNLQRITGKTNAIDFTHLVQDIMELNAAEEFMKCIDPSAESASILVAKTDFVTHPVTAFVRLVNAPQMGLKLAEVPLPVRFIFIYFVPLSANGEDHLEVGKTMATLLNSPKYRECAYSATSRHDLIDGLSSYLEDSVVIPSGQDFGESEVSQLISQLLERQRERRRLQRQLNWQAKKDKAHLDDGHDDHHGHAEYARTKVPFGGMYNDIKTRYPKYETDILDGLNKHCLAAIFFIYFVAVAPCITFGGLLSDVTAGNMGVTESLLITSSCGIVYSLFAGQPLILVAVTGPIVVVEEALYDVCQSLELEYLSVHFWVGLWLAVITIIVVALEGSVIIRYISRFTDEIFAVLFSMIFMVKAFKYIYKMFLYHPPGKSIGYAPYVSSDSSTPYPDLEDLYNSTSPTDAISTLAQLAGNLTSTLLPMIANQTEETTTSYDDVTTGYYDNSTYYNNSTYKSDYKDDEYEDGDYAKKKKKYQPNTALLSTCLLLGTFSLARMLEKFGKSHFINKHVQWIVGDFRIPIAIIVMVLVDWAIKDTYTEKLDFQDGLVPTAYGRDWLVHPLGKNRDLPYTAIFLAVVPALLIFILIFMEGLMIGMAVGAKLEKGSGYHLDLLLTGLFSVLAGMFGLPLLCAEHVGSVTHKASLCVYSRTYAPGEKPKLEAILEQRITGVAVHIIIGLSIAIGPLLRQIPMSVLYGVFLYMGVTTLSDNQFWTRCQLLFKHPSHHPDVSYVRRVKTHKMHLFTFVQIFIFGILCVFKYTKAALGFPLLLILCLPVRMYLLPFIFNEDELENLDSHDDEEDES